MTVSTDLITNYFQVVFDNHISKAYFAFFNPENKTLMDISFFYISLFMRKFILVGFAYVLRKFSMSFQHLPSLQLHRANKLSRTSQNYEKHALDRSKIKFYKGN